MNFYAVMVILFVAMVSDCHVIKSQELQNDQNSADWGRIKITI